MTGLACDLVSLGITAALFFALATGPPLYEAVFDTQSHLVLTLTSATVGAAAAILGDVATRLTRDPRPSWIAAALALYSLVVVPSSTTWANLVESALAARSARTVAFLTVAVLLILSIRPPRRLGTWGGWIIAGVAVGVCVLIGPLSSARPETFQALTSPALISAGALAAWAAVAVGFAIVGCRRGHEPLRRVGLGLLLVAGAQLYRGTVGLAVTTPDLAFDVTRLLGLVMVLIGAMQLAAGGMHRIRSERMAYEEDLRIASAHMDRAVEKAAERDHELRNGLSGLSGVANLLSSAAENPEQKRLRSAVLRELARLDAMLADGPASPMSGYDVGTVLGDIVTLRRSSGLTIELALASELRAAGTAAVLAQVVTNLLANAAQHAQGSPVRVTAGRCGTRIIVEVADDGPGIVPGQERLVVERGVRHPDTGGSGLGLHVSRQLLASEGGHLRIAPRPPGEAGCTVVVELPSADSGSAALGPELGWRPYPLPSELDPARAIGAAGLLGALDRPPGREEREAQP